MKIDRGAPPSGGRSRWLVAVIVIGALGVAGYALGYRKIRESLTTPEVRIGEISLVSPVQSQVQLTATGYVVALVYAKVASKVPGRIAEIFVEEGQTIEKGARVARLEDVDFKTTLASARARAAAARAKVAIARASLAEIRVQIERETPMVEKGVTAKATLDDLAARRDSAMAAIRAAEADAGASDAETKALEVQLGSYEIITPISGTVVDKLVKVGEGVSPGFGTPGVIEVIDMTSLVVEVDVPEGRLSQVAVDGPCEIVLDAYPAKRYRGAVKELGRRVNRSKATVPVKIRFVDRGSPIAGGGDPDGSAGGAGGKAPRGIDRGTGADPPGNGKIDVLPDMAARVSFLAQAVDPRTLDTPPKLVVPAAAVARRGGRDVVFVVDEDQVRETVVTLGPPVGDGRELVTQLPAGTKVVLQPPAQLGDGQKVKENKSR
ncbi:MAG TPA: efflux RND transporter periplasmic adaptor subunit [Kofleriaceae bacterium]|nr:efflux RND transporter periplasmic adaptor subunit [Kofleriaceae bacterium]